MSKIITQQMLAKHRDLSAQAQKYKQAREQSRDKLKALLESGANIEPGKLKPVITQTKARVLTRARVINALGEDGYEHLCDQVGTVIRRCFKVIQTEAESPFKLKKKPILGSIHDWITADSLNED